MLRLISIMFKRATFSVSIPFFIELIFLLISIFYTSSTLNLIHSLWFTLSVSILTLYLSFDCFNFYYLGNDTLLHIMPFSNEFIMLVKVLISSIILWSYSFIGFIDINLENKQTIFRNFAYFGLPKICSLLSFFSLLCLSLILVKSVRSAKTGLITVLLINITLVFAVFFSSIKIYSSIINHWIIGISSSTLSIPIYANILQIEILTNQKYLAWYMLVFNVFSTIVFMLTFLLIHKKKSFNYLTLTF